MVNVRVEGEHHLPSHIEGKIYQLNDEVKNLVIEGMSLQKTNLDEAIRFEMIHSAPENVINAKERAQSICFTTRYVHLPILEEILIIEKEDGYHLGNIAFMRHLINEYRSIVFNQNDSIFYTRIHGFCMKKMKNRDPDQELSITALTDSGQDVTDKIMQILDERTKSIRFLLNSAELDYLYNGVLQHSDAKYSKRLLEEYHSGELNYLFLKHALLLSFVKDLLSYHHTVIRTLTFPRLGAL